MKFIDLMIWIRNSSHLEQHCWVSHLDMDKKFFSALEQVKSNLRNLLLNRVRNSHKKGEVLLALITKQSSHQLWSLTFHHQLGYPSAKLLLRSNSLPLYFLKPFCQTRGCLELISLRIYHVYVIILEHWIFPPLFE